MSARCSGSAGMRLGSGCKRSSKSRISAQPERGASSSNTAFGALSSPVHSTSGLLAAGSPGMYSVAVNGTSFTLSMPLTASPHGLGAFATKAMRRPLACRASSQLTNCMIASSSRSSPGVRPLPTDGDTTRTLSATAIPARRATASGLIDLAAADSFRRVTRDNPPSFQPSSSSAAWSTPPVLVRAARRWNRRISALVHLRQARNRGSRSRAGFPAHDQPPA